MRILAIVTLFTLGSIASYAANDRLARRVRTLADKLERSHQLSQSERRSVRQHIQSINAIIDNGDDGGDGGDGGDHRRNIRLNELGILQVRVNGEWGGVCDDSFDEADARVACRQLGGRYVSHSTGIGGENSKFWLDDLRCVGDENLLTQCPNNGIGNHNCGSTEHVSVVCDGLPTDGRRTARINDFGLLEVRISGQWKGVCDDSFDANDAEVACRQMGSRGHVRYNTGVGGPHSNFGLDDLGCRGTEATLQTCSHAGLNTHNCGTSEWVSLICQ